MAHAWHFYMHMHYACTAARLAADSPMHMHIHMQTATPSAVTLLESWSQREHAHLSYTNSERTLHDLWMRRDTNVSGCIGNTSTKLKHCRTQARAWHSAWCRAWCRAWCSAWCIAWQVIKLHCSQAGERSSVVAQAVNALIASRARVFVSPPASMWTSFISGLLRRRASDAVSSSPSDVDKRLVEIHRVPSVRNNALRSGKGGGQPATVDAAGWTDF